MYMKFRGANLRILALAVSISLGLTVCFDASAQTKAENSDVKQIRLIENNYIEILWKEKVKNSTIPENYKMTLNGKSVQLDPGSCYYYDRMNDNMTSLKLADPVSKPEDAKLTLTVVNDGKDDIRAVSGNGKIAETKLEFGYEPFYQKKVTSKLGFPVKGSKNVNERALQIAADTADFMLSKRPDIAKAMSKNKADIAVSASNENAYYLPEGRGMTDNSLDPDKFPARGLAGNKASPTVMIAQDELLQNDKSKYPRENVFVHEFGHTIKFLGVADIPDLIHAYEDAYVHAKKSGRWDQATYLISNQEEFFACTTNIWFESVLEREDSTALVNTKKELQIFDPQAYEFFSKIYPDERLPESCWDYAGKFKNEIQITEHPPAKAPAKIPDLDSPDAPKAEYNLSADYFKILSYLGTNVIQSDGQELNTWWDFSNTWANYNFDALSWRVIKEGDYYRFVLKKTETQKKDLAIMPKDGGATEGTPLTVGAVNQQDDSQLWQLVGSEGYLCQIVNKKSGLVIGTEKGILPTDGTVLVLTKYEQNPSYTNQWRVLRLKDKPGDESLVDDKYAIKPVKADRTSVLKKSGAK